MIINSKGRVLDFTAGGGALLDSIPTDGSSNGIDSNAVYDAIHALELSTKVYVNPVFTYGVDGISRIEYTNGYKEFTYIDGVLSSINIDGIKIKTFTYDDNGMLISIVETSA